MNANAHAAAYIQRVTAKAKRIRRWGSALEVTLYAVLSLATATIVAGVVHSHAAHKGVPVQCGK
jgi:hypothetical protein